MKSDCGTGVGPPATTTGAGLRTGSALVVANAAGAPGAAVLGAAAGAASGDNVVTPEDKELPDEDPDENGPVAEGINGTPGATLVWARADEFRASSPNPK